MKIRYLGKTRIDVSFRKHTFKLYVSKYSTCDDVIQSVLSKQPNYDTKADTLAVFERSGGIERMLGGSTRVLKIVRSWGCEGSKFELVINRKSAALELKREFRKSTGNDEFFMDEVYKKRFRKKNAKMNDFDVSTFPELEPSEMGRYNGSVNLVPEKQSRLNLNDQMIGKNALLSRYFSDVILHRQKTKCLSNRRSGDGSENPMTEVSRGSVDGLSNSGLLEACRKSWQLHSDTDDDTDDDSIGENDYDSVWDNEYSLNVFNATEEKMNELDIAFVKSYTDSDTDEGIDVTSVNSGDLNTAFVGGFPATLEDDFDSEDSPSNTSYESSSSSVGFERRYCIGDKIDFVKQMFGKKDRQSEDEAMESFMESRLDSF